MVEAVIGIVALLAVTLFFAARRAKRRRNVNPGDIYPHW
jgi:hypothetical protein